MKRKVNIINGNYYCECNKKVTSLDNYCSNCGAKLEFIPCEHKEAYSKHYVDYDRNRYTIYCCECHTELDDVSINQYPEAKIKYNVIEER